jgi:hypothetical protein
MYLHSFSTLQTARSSKSYLEGSEGRVSTCWGESEEDRRVGDHGGWKSTSLMIVLRRLQTI